jgi:hypothetical protein
VGRVDDPVVPQARARKERVSFLLVPRPDSVLESFLFFWGPLQKKRTTQVGERRTKRNGRKDRKERREREEGTAGRGGREGINGRKETEEREEERYGHA